MKHLKRFESHSEGGQSIDDMKKELQKIIKYKEDRSMEDEIAQRENPQFTSHNDPQLVTNQKKAKDILINWSKQDPKFEKLQDLKDKLIGLFYLQNDKIKDLNELLVKIQDPKYTNYMGHKGKWHEEESKPVAPKPSSTTQPKESEKKPDTMSKVKSFFGFKK